MSVSRAKTEINAREFAQWRAFGTIEPFGDLRMDFRFALMTFHIVRALVTPESSSGMKVTDFMLDFSGEKRQEREQTDEEIEAILLMAFGAIGAI